MKVVLLYIIMMGSNVEHLNSGGIQLAVTPIRFESLTAMEDCEREKPAILRRVLSYVRKAEKSSGYMKRERLNLEGSCEPLE